MTMCCGDDYLIAVEKGTNSANQKQQLSSPVPTQQRQENKVSFNKKEVISRIMASSDMRTEERNEIWYNHAELNEFKNEAKSLSRKLLQERNQQSNQTADDNRCTRGLEHRISEERQRKKCLVMKAILKAQRRFKNNPEKLALIAVKCTAWAREVALCTGYRDFYLAYKPSMLHLVPKVPRVEFPMISKKRSSSSSDEEELATRNKRQRTLSPDPTNRSRITSTAVANPLLFSTI